MSKKYRIGVLGMTHDHIWDNLPDVRSHDATELVAAADPHGALLERVSDEYDCKTYSNYVAMLDAEQLDAVYIYSDNAAGVELTEMAAERGLSAVVEKPMASSLAGAERMLQALSKAGTRLMVNWPFAWWPQLQHAIALTEAGEIGDVWQVKYRAAHAGPRELGCSEFFCDWLFDPERNGPGGAYMDYCCYGALLARALMGLPDDVFAQAGRLVKTECPVEDNAILVMNYANGMAVSEGSWSQVGKLTAYATVIYGTTGTMMLEPRAGGRLYVADDMSPDGRVVAVPDPPESMRSATAHFISGLSSGEPFWTLCDETVCRDTQQILELGAESMRRP